MYLDISKSMMKNKLRLPVIPAYAGGLVILLLLRIIFAFVVWHPDLNNHSDWGTRFFEYGAKGFYAPEANVWSYTWPNQPPGTIYMFAGVRKIFEFVFNIFWQINISVPVFPSAVMGCLETNLYPALLKLPAILADFGIAYLIYLWTKKKWSAVVWLINPVIWYNSTVWGQYDSVINLFALLSFYLLLKRNLSFSFLAFAFSIYIKASLLIFAPIWLVFALSQKYKARDFVVAVVCSLLAISLLTLPFADKNPIIWLYELYQNKIFAQQLHVITANAFNLWSAIAGIHERPDSLPFLGLTYQYWSYILFSLVYLPLMKSIIKNHNSASLIWTLALTAFASFTLLTNMHERYLYPLFPYLTILLATGAIGNWYYWIISAIGLLNMYNFWFTPRIEYLVSFLSFGDRLLPRILGFVMLGMFLGLYRRYTYINGTDSE
jgi:dolichyl-phosphate-mannose-protein mannosyltransferase